MQIANCGTHAKCKEGAPAHTGPRWRDRGGAYSANHFCHILAVAQLVIAIAFLLSFTSSVLFCITLFSVYSISLFSSFVCCYIIYAVQMLLFVVVVCPPSWC